MSQAAAELMATVFEQASLHPLAPVKPRVSVNEPEAPAVTVTVWLVAAPLMLPLPLMVQVYDVAPGGPEKALSVALGQAEGGPVIEQPTPTDWLQEVLPLAAVKVTLRSKPPVLGPALTPTEAVLPVPLDAVAKLAPALLFRSCACQVIVPLPPITDAV